MAADVLCLTLPQAQASLEGVPIAVIVYTRDAVLQAPHESLYCIRQLWREATGHWELVITPFSHGIS